MTDPILLTPGPLTTSTATRNAMNRDWGSWDTDFTEITRDVLTRIEQVAEADDRLTCVPMQGSGTFAVEAAIRTLVPAGGDLVVAVNGAYGARIAEIARRAGRNAILVTVSENAPVDAELLGRTLDEHPDASHVAVVHCETSTGLLNPIDDIVDIADSLDRRVIIDAMSSFGALNLPANHPGVSAIVAASGKCLEGPPGMGFVLATDAELRAAQGQCDSLALDLSDQYVYLRKTGQWRFTPPTHVVAALREALVQHQDQGGRSARLARYAANGSHLLRGMTDLGFVPYLPAALQAPIIYTFHSPRDPAWSFPDFYDAVKQRGFVLYPGKLTEVETFRIGCIGAIDPQEILRAVEAVAEALDVLGVTSTQAAIDVSQSFQAKTDSMKADPVGVPLILGDN